MSPERKQTLKLLKVDNWSAFLLQRLQLMFAKGDCCDLTLRFDDKQELKVHKLVLTTCTKYFENVKEINKTIKMPENLTYTSMLPIINFMYSGKLEFKPELQESLLQAARVLNMTILVQLLIVQKGPKETKVKLTNKLEEIKKKPMLPIDPLQQSSRPIDLLAEKKLPFWRKRAFPLLTLPVKKEPEDPMPTRFELPSEDTSSFMLNVPSFNEISYESEPVVPSPIDFPFRERQDPSTCLKRRVVPPPTLSQAKAQKLTESQIISGTWSEDEDDAHFGSIHTYEDSDDEPDPLPPVSSTPKPILKPAADQVSTSSAKRVRFNLYKEDKENTTLENNETKTIYKESSQIPSQSVTPVKHVFSRLKESTEKDKPKEEPVANHAKIIAEVLKKFPNLVKNNKNIKLKITSPAGLKTVSMDGSQSEVPATKSSLLVVKPNMVKVEPQAPVQFCQEAENASGPWICKRCTIDQRHLVFESYFLFRKHLTGVHSEKIDPKICELCGYKASKKNLHLFHLFTRHGIEPPKNVFFPKCMMCKYVALNDTLLMKHYSTHQANNKELVCNICKLSFKSINSFQTHCLTCKPNSEMRTYPCKSCSKVFRTSVSLKAHFKDCTGSDTSHISNVEPVEMIEVPIMGNEGKVEHSLVQLPPRIIVAESPDMTLINADGNGLSNVTSTIPNLSFTVLPEEHQTVILLDENSEFFLQGNNSMVVTSDNNDEYVVPEILQDNMAQLYSTSNISYTMDGTSVITYPVVHVQQDGSLPDHSSDTMSLPVGQRGELYVSNKEITISEDLQSMKPHLEQNKNSLLRDSFKDNNIQITPENEEVVQDVHAVTPTSCIMRIDNTDMALGSSVCLVDSNTPINNMNPNRSTVNISMNTPVSIVDADTPVSLVGSDTQLGMVHRDNLTDQDIKATVISVVPDQAIVTMEDTKAKIKVDQISDDWDFDADDKDMDVIDDPDSMPSRPSIDLQEMI